MLPYATIGSSSITEAYQFLRQLCLKLKRNGYPYDVLLRMWDDAYPALMEQPCRKALCDYLPLLHLCVSKLISQLF